MLDRNLTGAYVLRASGRERHDVISRLAANEPPAQIAHDIGRRISTEEFAAATALIERLNEVVLMSRLELAAYRQEAW